MNTQDMTIAIVDDDPGIVTTVSDYLKYRGFRTKGLFSGEELLEYLKTASPDLIVLDLVMPGMDGFQVCRAIKERERLSNIPVIILSGKTNEGDKVSGLETGADDYVVKPFSLEELRARINAVLRRGAAEKKGRVLSVGGIMELDMGKHRVLVNGEKVELTPSEFRILELLSSRKGQAFSRERILDYLWGDEKVVVERTVDVHIRHLRGKLGKAGAFIKNVRGVGYTVDDGV